VCLPGELACPGGSVLRPPLGAPVRVCAGCSDPLHLPTNRKYRYGGPRPPSWSICYSTG